MTKVVMEEEEVSTRLAHCPSLEGRSEKCLSVLQSGFVTSSKTLKKLFAWVLQRLRSLANQAVIVCVHML